MLNKEEILTQAVQKLKNFSILTEKDIVEAVHNICDEYSADYPIDDNWWAELFYILSNNGIKLGVRSELKESVFSKKLEFFLSKQWQEPTEQSIVKQLLSKKSQLISQGEQAKEYLNQLIQANKPALDVGCSEGFIEELGRLANDYLAEAKNLPVIFKKNAIKKLEYLLQLQIQESWDAIGLSKRLQTFKVKYANKIFDTSFWQYITQAIVEKSLNTMKATIKLAIESLKSSSKKITEVKFLQEATEEEIEFADDFRKAFKTGGYELFVTQLKHWASEPKIHNFLQAGLKDGNTEDDKFDVELISLKPTQLYPTQSEIDIEKSLKYNLKSVDTVNKLLKSTDVVLGGPVVIFNGKYIIDGHHRWSQIYCGNPNTTMRCINLKKASITPDEMLKSVQVAIAATTGNVPLQNVKDTNLITADGGSVKAYIMQGLDEKVLNAYKAIKKFRTREDVANYLWSNCELMQKRNTPIPGSHARDVMPQTDVPDGNMKNVLGALTKGYANPMEPYIKMESKRNSMKRLNENTLTSAQVRKIANNAGEWVLDAKSELEDLLIGWDDTLIPVNVVIEVLDRYDLSLDDVTDNGEESAEEDFDFENDSFNREQGLIESTNKSLDSLLNEALGGFIQGFDSAGFNKPKQKQIDPNPTKNLQALEESHSVHECEKCASENVSQCNENGLYCCKDCKHIWMPDSKQVDELEEKTKMEKPKKPKPNSTPPELGTSDETRHMTNKPVHKLVEAFDKLKEANQYYNGKGTYDYSKMYDNKDKFRIADIADRAKGNIQKVLQLAKAMANKITDKGKALRRGYAAADAGFSQAANLFFNRAEMLSESVNCEKGLSESIDDTLDNWLTGGDNKSEINDKIKKDKDSSDIETVITKGLTKPAEQIETEQECEFDDVEVWKEYIKINFKGSVKFEEEEQAFDEDSETIYAMCGEDVIGVFKGGYGKLVHSSFDEVKDEELDRKLSDTIFEKGTALKENKLLKEAGEWDNDGDMEQEMVNYMQSELRKLRQAVGPKLQVGKIVPFDKYQGCYAVCAYKDKRFKFWIDEHGQLLDEKTGKAGMPEEIAEWILGGSLVESDNTLTGTKLKDLSNAAYVTIPKPIFERLFYRLVDNLKNDWSKIAQYNVWKVLEKGAEKFKVQNVKAKNWIYNIPVGKLFPTAAPVIAEETNSITEETTTADIAVFDAPATLVRRKQFKDFVQENCQVERHIKKGQFDIEEYLKTRPSWFKKQLVKEFNLFNAKKNLGRKKIKESPGVAANYSDEYFDSRSYAMTRPLDGELNIHCNPEDFVASIVAFTPYDETGNPVGRTANVKCNDIKQIKNALATYKKQYAKASEIRATVDGKKVGSIISESFKKKLTEGKYVPEVDFEIEDVQINTMQDEVVFVYHYPSQSENQELPTNLNTFKKFCEENDPNWDVANYNDLTGNEDYPQGFEGHDFDEYWRQCSFEEQVHLATKFLINKMGVSPRL